MYVGTCPETLIQIPHVICFVCFTCFYPSLKSVHIFIYAHTSALYACLLSHVRLGFFFFFTLILCHSFTCSFINAIGAVLLGDKYRVSHALEMSMHLCLGFVLIIWWNMFRCMIMVSNVLMPGFWYVLCLMICLLPCFRCMIRFSHVRWILGFLLYVWLSFVWWIDKYVCLGWKMPCCMLNVC